MSWQPAGAPPAAFGGGFDPQNSMAPQAAQPPMAQAAHSAFRPAPAAALSGAMELGAASAAPPSFDDEPPLLEELGMCV